MIRLIHRISWMSFLAVRRIIWKLFCKHRHLILELLRRKHVDRVRCPRNIITRTPQMQHITKRPRDNSSRLLWFSMIRKYTKQHWIPRKQMWWTPSNFNFLIGVVRLISQGHWCHLIVVSNQLLKHHMMASSASSPFHSATPTRNSILCINSKIRKKWIIMLSKFLLDNQHKEIIHTSNLAPGTQNQFQKISKWSDLLIRLHGVSVPNNFHFQVLTF